MMESDMATVNSVYRMANRRAYRASRKAWQAERRQARQLKSAALLAYLFGGDA